MYLYLSLAMTVSAGVGFVYGLYRFFRDESALYVRMIIFSVGCAMFGRLFETLQYLVNGELGSGFHVGMLGIVGSFLVSVRSKASSVVPDQMSPLSFLAVGKSRRLTD